MNTPFYFNDVFDTNILSTLNSTEGRVYMAYLRYSNGGRDIAYPSQAHLAWSLGVDPKTIGRAVKVLQQKKFIVQVRSGKGGQSTKASEYTVKTPAQLGYFPKKRANQAPVPPAPVPTPTKQPRPQPAPAAAPAPVPVVSTALPVKPASKITSQQLDKLRQIYFESMMDDSIISKSFKSESSFIEHVDSELRNTTKGFDIIIYELKKESLTSQIIEEEIPF